MPDLSWLGRNPYILCVGFGFLLVFGALSVDLKQRDERNARTIQLQDRLVENVLLNEYMDKKLTDLIVQVEHAKSVSEGGTILRQHQKDYREAFVKQFDVARITKELDQYKIPFAYSYLLFFGEAVGVVMFLFGLFMIWKEHNEAPPIGTRS